jgi:type IV pilus biogenesis protein CpaD/CtpE
MKTLTAAGAILILTAIGASAQTPNTAGSTGRSAASPNGSAQDQANSAASEPLRQQVRDNLAKAGFTDIRIMPTSFMVRAKDQSGNPVMMVINPDSFTEVTAMPANTNQSGAQTNNSGATAPKH